MQTIEKYGYKWSKKKSGYYQSTSNFPDGRSHWLHQEVYAREVDKLLAGHSIHHIDENKDNNEPSNLEQLTHSEHAKRHVTEDSRLIASNRFKENNEELQKLVILAKKGEYIGIKKRRELMKGNKVKECGYCGNTFTLKERDRGDSKYCSTQCAQRASKLSRNVNYVPIPAEDHCVVCNSLFVPKTGNQICCSTKCQRINTENQRLNDFVIKQCKCCGADYETVRTSKRIYCSDTCRKLSRKKKN
jgi:predicted nucleic acid-binding Zn ribbon protein